MPNRNASQPMMEAATTHTTTATSMPTQGMIPKCW